MAVQDTGQEIREVALAETQRMRRAIHRKLAFSLPGGMLSHHLSRQFDAEFLLGSAGTMRGFSFQDVSIHHPNVQEKVKKTMPPLDGLA